MRAMTIRKARRRAAVASSIVPYSSAPQVPAAAMNAMAAIAIAMFFFIVLAPFLRYVSVN